PVFIQFVNAAPLDEPGDGDLLWRSSRIQFKLATVSASLREFGFDFGTVDQEPVRVDGNVLGSNFPPMRVRFHEPPGPLQHFLVRLGWRPVWHLVMTEVHESATISWSGFQCRNRDGAEPACQEGCCHKNSRGDLQFG